MGELRKRVEQGPRLGFLGQAAAQTAGQSVCWSTTSPTNVTYPNSGRALVTLDNPPNYLLTLATPPSGSNPEGNATLQTRVFVDVPGSSTTPASNFAVTSTTGNNSFISQLDNPNLRDPDGVDRSRWCYRIRALGVAGVSGPARPNLEKLDNRLRRFSFFSDWRTGGAVSTPQVARMVEAVAQPETNFRNALMADKQIDLNKQDVLVDSYDSSKGTYSSSTNHGNMGNLATNGKLINANGATVDGDAMTNNGTVNDGDNVSGQQSGNFYQELTPFSAGLLNPTWGSVQDGGTLTGSTTYTANVDSTNPTLVHLDGINLATNGNVIKLAAPAAGSGTTTPTPSYIKIYVQGDITTAGSSYINLDPNVSAIIYVTGNVNLQGSGIVNNSQLARQLVINGIQPAVNKDGTYPTPTINIATTQDFQGIIYAPNHDLTLALQAVVNGVSTPVTPSPPVVTSTGSASQIPNEVNAITQAANAKYNLQLDYQDQLAKYQKNGDQGAYQKMLQDTVQAGQQQTLIDQHTIIVFSLGGTVTVTFGSSTVNDSSAADHALGYNGIYGGFVAKDITVAAKTHIHYDETLRTAGPVNHYEIVSWFEDNVSHGAVGSSTAFWWAGAP